jgi:hypothetical protein
MRSVRPEGAAGTNDNVDTIGKRKPTGVVEFAIRDKEFLVDKKPWAYRSKAPSRSNDPRSANAEGRAR